MMQYVHIIIPSYGLMAGIGAVFAVTLLFCRFKALENVFGFTAKDFRIVCLLCAGGCLIGSKLLFGLTQIPKLITDFSLAGLANSFIFGGFVFYGGLLGAFGGSAIYANKKGIALKTILDIVTPVFVLFHVFGRIGCLFAGCCYGFKLSSELVIGNVHFLCFPLQAVEALVELTMFFLLEKTGMKADKFKWYMTCYPVYRFIAEFFRGDAERGIWFGLSTSQWISLLILLAGAIIHFKNKKNESGEIINTS